MKISKEHVGFPFVASKEGHSPSFLFLFEDFFGVKYEEEPIFFLDFSSPKI